MTYYSQNCQQSFAAPTVGITGYLKRIVGQWLYSNRLRSSIQRERLSLASMSDEMLKDIGIDRIAANRESVCREIPATRKDASIA
jgi:uncharacterized protein YjiS (DUF1127 family)